MSLNVNRDIEDVYYRYKMPKLMVKVEGKGNGIKTVISNINDIAKAIYRKPTYPIKYFGIELGSQTNMDEKNERFVVNGAHESAKLQEMLHTFIKKFVLCSQCGNPETMLTIKKKAGNVITKCKACGQSDMLDLKHKLTQYIIKNPPENEMEGAAPVREDDKNEDNEEIATVPEEDTWLEEPSNNIAPAKEDKSSSRTAEDLITEFYNIVNTKFLDGTLLRDYIDVRKKAKQFRLDEKCVLVLIEIIFKNPRTIITDIEKYKSVFHPFTRVGPTTDRFQMYVIAGILKLVDKFNFGSKTNYLMQAFYDQDIIEEDAILDWFDKGPSKKYVSRDLSKEALEACKPMVEWLRAAEEESVDEEEEEEEGEDHRETSVVGHRQPVARMPLMEIGDDDEIDIDNI